MSTSSHSGDCAAITSNSNSTIILSAIGVVFGDIGTSPLYTLKEAFSPNYGLAPNHDTVLGILSLIFWAMMLVVTIKYVTVIMRVDNDGEGGIMALTALTQRTMPFGSRSIYIVGILGIFGTSLFFGDGIITPAISVLSAVEGLEVAEPHMKAFVVPITLAVLILLFLCQRFGTERVGKTFGPITFLWFIAIGVVGVYNIIQAPEVLYAINPWWGLHFFLEHGWHSMFVLGAVVLAVTGGEALYADMGHFGAKAIRHAWMYVVLPMLALNYLGQGALVLSNPTAIGNPFYQSIPDWGLYPMIALATAAAVIASQALITGSYSLSSQAMQLGYIPRMNVRHTSQSTIGQIYVPTVNWTLLMLVILTVIGFGDSTSMASAYGVAVTGTMMITTVLMIIYARANPRVPRLMLLMIAIVFIAVDGAFFYANIIKFMDGAWFPLLLGVVIFTFMRTWLRGRKLLHEEMRKDGINLDNFLPGLMLAPPVKVPGTAVFLTADSTVVPHALMHNLKHNKVLHERNVFLTVKTLKIPYAANSERLKIEPISNGFYRVHIRFGFMETPDVPSALMCSKDHAGIDFDPMHTTFFVSRETVIPSANRGMPIWRDKLFVLMHRNAAPANAFFRIPGNRLVELGTQVEI
ncbi:potassium transporter Kup [Xylella fastidiosa subsp. fastidiosa]|jgi:KUP system potassium uptake protein|uniref:Probable potassium transport system protein Kup n=3 Tax=Xylella fastidiosa TaxID=2371 RepID=KUP_XYLFT|nr:potassium transporter Kup [Xylella fastidiosa]Q87D01.1 RecName: Full=Probable potassium transport system protein Kup [Xylella fastidiosa Temecula1]ADN63912.1 potassium uptake protein [Xylella fastidiosa subsp. fastidiosa GB514]KAF0571221.1 potassium transporter Kup [Xylella fastidiosa subsp. fastidiosa Mus-1]AAO28753.1 potassium uptake protein [Xylella fastidiosa Temecula1]ACB92375.1 K potassium transporter [Xylella fastidiosa M23]EGO81860.1 K+ transporter Kup [Xylella fastidiosa EB92.1]